MYKNITKKLSYFLIIISVLMSGFMYECGKRNVQEKINKIGPNEIWIQNDSFKPSEMNITSGTQITWINKDNVNHSVTSGTPDNPTELFDSGNIQPDSTFSYTFETIGTFKYYCKNKPDMLKGKIIVE